MRYSKHINMFNSGKFTFVYLTHWGRVTHICVGNQNIIGSGIGFVYCLSLDVLTHGSEHSAPPRGQVVELLLQFNAGSNVAFFVLCTKTFHIWPHYICQIHLFIGPTKVCHIMVLWGYVRQCIPPSTHALYRSNPLSHKYKFHGYHPSSLSKSWQK